MKNLLILAISHKELCVEEVGKFHISPDIQAEKLQEIKRKFNIQELMFLSTCNRVEWILSGIPSDFNYPAFLARVYPNVAIDLLKEFQPYQDKVAVEHAMKVAASMESMVVGEREIITQFRSAFEFAEKNNLVGESIKLLANEVVLTAKRIFSETDIATKPVSVVSIAFKEFQELTHPKDAKVVVVGSGQTNTNFLRFLKKHHPGFSYTIYNRTLESGEELAAMVDGSARELKFLSEHQGDVDILVACTGAEQAIINHTIVDAWREGNNTLPKVVIDLGLPADVDPTVADDIGANLISMARLQPISKSNLAARHQAVRACSKIIAESLDNWDKVIRNRQLELALQGIPAEMRKFRDRAEKEIFATELEQMDELSRKTVEKMLDYLEKKYVGIPYKITKSVLLD
ncbi:glutamyl-tRNA reductase [Luteibaculum oceani]|uniref:glutamyl-tRNA reductase n=1 Tax=Luteibaculum oceani TaxID=1294296 RepID=UPI0014777D30|nr:glutamyl-tRNA reductase [Luteibaculum oceani]